MASLKFVSRALLPLLVCVSVPAAQPAPPAKPWWQSAVIYEIYPRSFQDSNGDGVGDLNGITQRLEYLQKLGIDAIWIAPMYPSPQVDFGYDIADYEAVDPQYGSLADLDRLVAAAKQHHIRVILDMVLNHTSDQHPWYLDASQSRTSAHHDFYVWNDGKLGANAEHRPPNNWVSLFGGSAWQWVPGVDQFYYHMFYRQQPDLNWRNPKVESAMFAAMRFWLDRGVAGFRLDAIPALFEDPRLRDEPTFGGTNAQGDANVTHEYTNNLPQVHAVMRRMRAMVDRYPDDRVLIGETYVPHTRDLDAWYGGERHNELHLPMDTLVGLGNKLSAAHFRQMLFEADTQLHGSPPLFVFDNHDNIRSWERFGDGVHNADIAKIVAALLLTSRSAALLYQGEELGQVTSTPTRLEDVKDPIGRSGWPKEKGRDGERSPMQWDDSNEQAGFSNNAKPWLPVPKNYKTVNVAQESRDPNSILSWHRRLLEIRRNNLALSRGRLVMLDKENLNVLSYARELPNGGALLVCLNMSPSVQTVAPQLRAALEHARWTPLLSNHAAASSEASKFTITLQPFGAWIGSNQP